MKRTLVTTLCVLAAGCSGDDAMMTPTVDAAPMIDAAPVPTGYTAKGGFAVALGEARARSADAVSFTVSGQHIVPSGGVIDPADAQSYWGYAFLDLGRGKRFDVLWLQDAFRVSEQTANTETSRTITTAWIDSDVALAKLDEAGFVLPGAGEPFTTVSMALAMYVGQSEDLQAIEEPIWRVTKVTAPPGETPQGEEWLVTHWAAMDGYLVCSPAECTILP
ncbi:MAG: hypothetical protein EXR73_11125 [Myxococcales bacterium]|nr:hypothetical protein [Myxococcales bacterium]